MGKKVKTVITPDNSGYKDSSNKLDESVVERDFSGVSAQDILRPSEMPGYSKSSGYGKYGESQYDRQTTSDYFRPDESGKAGFEYQRGEAQPWYDKAANGLVNMAGRTLTSGAEGILNPLVGTFYAIKDQKFSSFYDNPFTKTLDEADKQIKDAIPFYSTKREDEAHGFEKLMYGNTLWRDVLDGVGYSLGAIGSGSAYTKAFTALGKTAMVGKAGEYLEGLRKIENAVDKKKFIENTNLINSFKDGISNGVIAGLGAMSESSANARSDKNEFRTSMSAELVKSQGFPLTDSQKQYIEMLAEEAGNSSFALNMPIIMLDNWITFGKNVFGNKATDKLSLKVLGEGVEKDAFDEAYKVAKKTGIDKAIAKTYGARQFAEPIIAEGFFQEQSQYGITKGVNDYYKKKFYNPEAASFIDSFGKGVYEAYGTKEGWDQGIVGALSGGLMGNATHLMTHGVAGYKDPSMTNAVPQALSNLSTKKTYEDLVSKAMRHGNLLEEQKIALDNNDTFNYENAKNDAFVNYASTKAKYGKTDDLVKEMEQFKSMTEEEFKSNFGSDMTVDQMTQTKQSVSQFVEDRIKKIKSIQRAYDIIDERFPNASDGNKERLAYASLTIDNSKDRKVSLNKDAREILMKNTHHVGEGVNPLVLMGNDYLSLSESERKTWKKSLLEANMNPMDLEEVLNKVVDIDKLEKRESQFVNEYKELLKEHVQAANDIVDEKAKKAAQTAAAAPVVVPPVPFGTPTPIVKTPEEIAAEAKAKADEEAAKAAEAAAKQQAAQQTTPIYDQAEADEWIKNIQDASPGQLDNLVNKAEQNFYDKYDVGLPKDIHDAYIDAKVKHEKFANYKSDLNDILNSRSSKEVEEKALKSNIKSNPLYSADKDAQQKISALHSELVAKEKETAIAEAKAAAEKAEQEKLNSNPVVLNQDDEPEKVLSLKPAVLNRDVFSRLDGPNTENKDFQNALLDIDFNSKDVLKNIKVRLFKRERVFKGKKVTHTIEVSYNGLILGYLTDPNAFDQSWIDKETENKQYLEEQRDLNSKFWNYITKNGTVNETEVSLDKLDDENIQSIGTTGGTLYFMNEIGGRRTIEETNQVIKLVEHDGKTVIIDTQKGELGKMFSLVGQDASFEDVFDAYPSENYGDRYLVAIKDSDGKTRFVPCQPSRVDESIMSETILQMKVQSEKAFKKNDEEILDPEINDKFNSDLNSKMFVTIPAESKGKAINKIFGIEFKVNVKGGVILDLNVFDNNSHIKIGLTHDELMNIKDLASLINKLNYEIDYAHDITKILSTEQKIKLDESSFRQSVDKVSIDEASKQLETSLNPSMPFTNARVKLNFNSEVLATKSLQKNESEAITSTAITDPKADIILPIGTSGSGKSTFIKSLPQENLVVISPDDMRVEFTGDINDKSKDKEIYIEAAKRAVEAIKQGKQVVFDTTNLTKDKRRPFIEAIKKAMPSANIQYKLMPLNAELAKQRIKAQISRGENRANVSDETIDRHAESYKQMLEDIKSEGITNYDTAKPSTSVKADKPVINIYWGSPESSTNTKVLSNLAPRKFTYQGKEYGSVEHAYQTLKSGTFDQVTYDKYVKAGGYGTKIRGKAVTQGFDNLQLMRDLVVESFKQNPGQATLLLNYSDFTHTTNEVIDKAFLEGLRVAQKNAELAALEGVKTASVTKTTDKSKSYEQLIEEAFTKGDIEEAQRLIDEQANQGFNDPLNSERADKVVEQSETSDYINMSEAKSWIKKNLPRFISVDDIDKILHNINVNGISWGAFQNSVIYLNSNAGKGTEFHEAFHAVFRTLLSEQEIRNYLSKAKVEYKGNIKEAIEKLKKQNPETANLSPQKLEDIVLEEYMADKFMEWKNNRSSNAGAGLKGLFAKIKDWAKFIISKKDTLDALFNKIDRGYFKNAKSKMNRFYASQQRSDKLVPASSSKFLSSQESDKVISTTTLRLGNRLAQRLPEDSGKSKIGVLKSLIDLMAKESDIKNNKELMDKLTSSDKMRFLKKLAQEKFTYTNKESVDLIINQVKSRLAMINASSEEESNDYESKEGELGNRFDLNASNIGGFGNINKAVRALIGMTTINEVDEFGRNTTRAVNVSTVFNGIERVLANTPKGEMINKLKSYSEYNPEVKVFFDKLAGLIDYNEETGTYTSNNTLKAFTSAFSKFKVKYIFGAIDISSNKYKFFDANQRDVAFKQVSDWNNSFLNNYNSLSSENKKDVLKKLNSLNGKYLAPKETLKKQLTQDELSLAIKEIKKSLNSIGIELSEGFISFSILNNRKLSVKQQKYVDSFGEIEPLQISGKDNDVVKTLLSTLNDNKDPYTKTITEEGVELEDDNYSKLKKIAENNSVFDETVGSSSFQNAEGETVYDKILGSFTIRRISELRSSDARNIKTYEEFRKANPEFSDYYSKGFYEFIKSNPLLNAKDADLIFDKSFAVNLIDGVAARRLSKNEETGELFINNEVSEEEGKTFKDMQIRDTLLMVYGLYEMEKEKSIKSKNGTKELFKYAQYYFKVLEASNTGYTVQLPKVKYFEGGKINEAAKSALNTFFKQEFDRMSRGFSEMKKIDNGDKSQPVVEGYHTSVKGNAPRAINFWNFKFLSEDLQNTLKDLASKGESIDDETMKLVESEIKSNFMKELASHFDKMVDLRVIGEVEVKDKSNEDLESYDKRYNNLMLPESFTKKTNLELSNANVANFFFNDLINVWSVNQLIDGDIAYSRIDEADYVKRNKGNNAMQQTFGEGKSRGAILEEPRVYVDKALNIVDKSHPEAQKIDTADAQMWESINWRIHKLTELGNFSETVAAVYEKIKNDEDLSDKDIKTLYDNDAMLISDKDIYFDGPNYLKLSSFCITRGYCSIKVPAGTKGSHVSKVNGKSYIADPRFEFEHNLLNKMEADNIDYVMPPSASKGATENVSKDINGLVGRSYDNKNFGRQHAVPSNKKTITDGSQKNGLIGSENEKASKLSEEHDRLLAQRAKNSMYKAISLLKNNLGDKSYTLKYVIDKFNETLQESGADINLLEFFAKDEVTGEPKFELNMPTTIVKFEQLFYAHFTKNVLYAKAPGYAAVLKSSHGVKVALDSKGNIITNADIKKGAKVSSTRELRHNVEEVDSNGKKTGRVFSEIMLPRHFAEFGIKPGDNLSEDVMKLLGFRIPTQDKNSMMTLKIVDFLPEYYGSTVIAPKEIVLLSGADYDVDKLFMRRYDHYVDDSGVVKIYSKNGSDLNTKWREFLIYEFSNNKDLSKLLKFKIKKSKAGALFSESLSDDITNDEVKEMMFYANDKATTEALAELGLPSSKDEYNKFIRENGEFNQGVINNQLLDTEIDLYSDKDIREIANTATSLESLEELIKDDSLPFGKVKNKFNINSINGRMASKEDNDTGKTNIGPSAVANMIFNLLAKNKIELTRKINFNGQEFDKFSYKNADGVRVNKLTSTILSAMTDNAKERLASVFNLTIDTIGPALYMTSIGIPIRSSMLITNSPIIREFSKEISLTKGAIKSYGEMYESADIIINDLLKGLRSKISEEDSALLSEELNESDLTSNDDIAKYKVLKFFKDINKDYDSFKKMNSIMQLNKGFNPKISENEVVNRSKEALGIDIKSEKEFSALNLPFDVRDLFKKNGYVQEGLKAHDEVQNKLTKNFFLSQSNLAKSIVKYVRANLKINKINSKEVFEDLNKNILTYLSTRAYENYLIKTGNNRKLNTLNVENITGENNIIDRVSALKNDPAFKDNFFLKNIIVDRVGGKNKILFDMITSNTRMKMHSSLLDRVIDGYTELYLNEETKQDAIDIFNYFVVKDGMQFKNKSISRYLGSFMFQTVSDSLKDAMSIIKNDTIDSSKFIETFGKNKIDLVEEILNTMFRYEPSAFDMVPYQKDLMSDVLKKTDNGQLEFNMYAGTKFVNTSVVSANEIEDVENQSKANKDKLSSNFMAIKNSLFKTKEINDKPYVIFPLFIRIGETYYELKNATNDIKRLNEDRRLIDLINDDGEAIGTKARYKEVSTFGIKDMNPFSLSLNDNLKVNEIFEANKAIKEEKKKKSKTKEGAIPELGEDYMDSLANSFEFKDNFSEEFLDNISDVVSDNDTDADSIGEVEIPNFDLSMLDGIDLDSLDLDNIEENEGINLQDSEKSSILPEDNEEETDENSCETAPF